MKTLLGAFNPEKALSSRGLLRDCEMNLPMVRLQLETLVHLQLGKLGLVGEEEGEVGGEDAVLHVAQHLLVLLGAQLGEDVVVLLNTCEGKYVSKSWNVDILFMTPLPLHCVISSGLKPFHCSFNVTILPAAE